MGFLLLVDRKFSLLSPHDPEECQKRIRDSIDSRYSLFGHRLVIGAADGGNIQLLVRKRLTSQYAALEAIVHRSGAGSRLECRLGMAASSKLGLGCITAFGVLVSGLLALGWINGTLEAGTSLADVFLPLGIVAAAWLITVVIAITSAGDPEYLVAHLLQVVDGELVPNGST